MRLRPFGTALLALASMAASPALAGSLAYDWSEGESIRYVGDMLLDSPTVIWVYGVENAQARIFQLQLTTQYDCKASAAGKNTLLTCSFVDPVVNGSGVMGDAKHVPAIMTEYSSILKDATAEITLRPDGHIKLVDLENLRKGLLRENEVHEILRQLVRRSVAPMGMQTPKGGEDPGRKWRHKGPNAFFELFSKYGSSGGMVYEYTVSGTEGSTTQVVGTGEATVATTAQREAGLPASLGLKGTGAYRFDSEAGQLAYAEVLVEGLTTASYSLPGSRQGFGYGARLMRINEDGSVEGPEGPVQ